MAAVSEMVGLGWGWVTALGNPGTVLSWLDPPTALGRGLANLTSVLGFGEHQQLLLNLVRDLGLLIAAVIGLRLLWESKGPGTMRAIGLTLLAVGFLGPTMQPWYVAWSVVVLATIAEHRLRVLVIVLSCVCSFFGLPGEGKLVEQFAQAPPLLFALACVAIVLILAIPLVIRIRRAFHPAHERGVVAVPQG
jgi:alpha-1,6-mannosyltransferase